MNKFNWIGYLFTCFIVLAIVLQTRPILAQTPPEIDGCQILPADNIWNTPINNLPVDPNSDAYINSIGPDGTLHPDFWFG